ncbi:MAG TPA: hypothetical protein VJG13_04550 [Thermoanaerobaculia bacterium]|nr:hypothetical protein [Thermoanaerobaculia bacterium]
MRHPRAVRLLLLLPLAAALALASCSDADEVDSGGVSLIISDFDGLPLVSSVNAAGGLVVMEEIELQSILQNPNVPSSNLQTIELSSYEVRYSRADTGTLLPTPLVEGLISSVPPGGNIIIGNLPILRGEQLLNPPLSDLLFVNGGFDRETGSDTIALNLTIRFFGRTLGGRDVVSNPQSFLVEFVP